MPPNVIRIAKNAKAYIHNAKLRPGTLLTASAPRYKIEARFTSTYSISQKTAMIIATVPLYLLERNPGIADILLFKSTARRNMATSNNDAAPTHSYHATAKPTMKAEPLMPINCSADIFDTIIEAPMAHQVKEPSARK